MNDTEKSILCELLISSEENLVGKILQFALENSYTKYTSTLKEAWRVSIKGLTDAIVDAVKSMDKPPMPYADMDFGDNSLNDFGITEARNHRKRGVSLELFLGLYKYYSQSFQDIITESDRDKSEKELFSSWIKSCFWYIEISYLREWTGKKSEELLEELRNTNIYMTNEKNRYLTVFESLASPVVLLDENHEIVNLNHSALKIFFNREIPGDMYYGDIDKSGMIPDLAFFMEEIKLNQNDFLAEKKMNTYEGVRYFEVKTKGMLDISRKFGGRTIIFSDITKRKEYEERLRQAKKEAEIANEAKSMFLSNMSHELRTPITGVIGLVDELGKTVLSDAQRKYVGMLKTSSDLLLFIINDLLDYMKLESDNFTLKTEVFSLKESLREIFELFEFRFSEKSLRFVYEIDSSVPEKVRADEYGIKQILMNLLGNALKFTHTGGVTVSVYRNSDFNLIIKVIDTGIGIEKDKLGHIFDRFFQADSSYNKKYRGTGLGLAIVKSLADKMGGEISVKSEKGHGSEFTVKLNLIETEIKPKTIETKKYNLEGIKILVAEDNEIIGFLIEKSLNDRKGCVKRVANGRMAVESVPDFEPDIIVMDGQMPVMNGFEAISIIKNDCGKTDIPIIALSGYTFKEEMKRFEEVKADIILNKPVNFDLLASKILELTSK